jgi:hypothetical protein
MVFKGSRKSADRAVVGIAMAAVWVAAAAKAEDAPELAHLVENPIAEVVSVPFQNNLTFGVGAHDDPLNVLNIQPVLPFRVSQEWNVISRTIIPVVHEPPLTPGMGSTDGVGDISLALYLSPAKTSSSFIWGVGPALTFPSATNDALGQGKFSAGLSAVALTIQGHWLVGALVTDVASVAGESDRHGVHQMLVQPFINYNLPHGWYLTASPIITSNWQARSGQQWTVPLGGGAGRTVRLGKQALNTYVQAFGNATSPHDAGRWTLRVQVQLLFPKSRS